MIYENPKQVYEDYLSGNLTPQQAAGYIDTIINGIIGISFKKDKSFTISNHLERYSLPNTKGMKKKELKDVYSFLNVLNTYTKGKSEIHIGKGVSSKHYVGGLKTVLSSAC